MHSQFGKRFLKNALLFFYSFFSSFTGLPLLTSKSFLSLSRGKQGLFCALYAVGVSRPFSYSGLRFLSAFLFFFLSNSLLAPMKKFVKPLFSLRYNHFNKQAVVNFSDLQQIAFTLGQRQLKRLLFDLYGVTFNVSIIFSKKSGVLFKKMKFFFSIFSIDLFKKS